MNKMFTPNNLNQINSEKLDWELIQSEMKNKLGSDIYESWLKKIEFVDEINNYILLSVPTRFIRDWITSRYLDQILQIVRNYKKEIHRIEFKIVEKNIINGEVDEIKSKPINDENVSFIKDSYLQYNRIDPNKRFDNFITGSSNKLAYEASLKVSESIAHYNPLYIYGGVGMGKTHLLNAIGLELKKNNKVMFISAERFMYQFVKSIKSNDMVKFKEYFRNTDILLIDDIQFMNGKEAMQEEFFHTFNALLDKGSQIIVSADRSPNKLSRIQERIKSRFSGGLVVDIQKPDYQLRKEIVAKKTEEMTSLYSDQKKISQDIQDFISNEITGSIRELVGAVNRLVSFSRIYNKMPNLSETKVVLKDLLNISENKVTIDLIQTIVCKFFKISKNEMLSARRSRYLVRPRQVAIYLTKILTSKSLPEIGREFSNRDHTTIIHSVKTVEKLKENDPEMVENINKLKNQILYKNQENEI
ncbi:chromosomal replication initiator protein DnaA [Candidatus Pelagibacter sp.]|uniref:chromosomal replication initiator protein DnaA n=1 Tax=Candidatus Pelagibacter sp. TaxID=2024849 RepID=UPI003F84F04E